MVEQLSAVESDFLTWRVTLLHVQPTGKFLFIIIKIF